MDRSYFPSLALFWYITAICTQFPGIHADGDNCRQDADCLNGGTCMVDINPKKCQCVPGWKGIYCKKIDNDCDPDPCLNGGTCIRESSNYRCECSPEYTGSRCESRQTATCSPPCIVDQGTCQMKPGERQYVCQCRFGYFGQDCGYSEVGNFKCQKPLDIKHENIFSSSTLNGLHPSFGLLLYTDGAWCAKNTDVNAYLEVRLGNFTLLNALAMQGDTSGNNYVNQFTLHVKVRPSATFVPKMTFNNNANHPNVVNKHKIHPPLGALDVRFVVGNYTGHYPCMRVALYGCPASGASAATCTLTVGLKNENFLRGAFFGQTDVDGHTPEQGILDNDRAWCTNNITRATLGFTLSRRDIEIVGFITQGHTRGWVTSYELEVNGETQTAAGLTVLSGNDDAEDYVAHFLDSTIPLYNNSTQVSFKPKSFHQQSCMRVELIGCDDREDPCMSYPCMHAGVCRRMGQRLESYVCVCNEGFSGDNCQFFEEECHTTAMDVFHEVEFSNKVDGFDNYRVDVAAGNAWCAVEKQNPWIRLLFKNVIIVYAVGIGGSANLSSTSLPANFKVFTKLLESDPLVSCRSRNSGDSLQGVLKAGDVSYHYIDSPREALEVKFEVFGHSSQPKCSRVDIIGCSVDYCAKHKPCMNGGSCVISRKHIYLCHCSPGYEGTQCQFEICRNCSGPYSYCNQTTGWNCQCLHGYTRRGDTCVVERDSSSSDIVVSSYSTGLGREGMALPPPSLPATVRLTLTLPASLQPTPGPNSGPAVILEGSNGNPQATIAPTVGPRLTEHQSGHTTNVPPAPNNIAASRSSQRASLTTSCVSANCNPVDGNFTEWSEWSVCSVSCGSGGINRTRKCSNPEPAHGGKNCSGLAVEDQYCSVPTVCDDEAGFTMWAPWSTCSVECEVGVQTRQRTCNDLTMITCNGPSNQSLPCHAGPCPVNGGYTNWQEWSPCSGFCGSGLKTRTRSCTNPTPAYNGAGCTGSREETRDCQHNMPCAGESGFGSWSQWTLCTQSCGRSVQIRTRKCQVKADQSDCSAATSQTKTCDKGPCPVHGNWAVWSNWGSCSESCGSGMKQRMRICTNPVPSYGGLPCFENFRDYKQCVLPLSCPGDDEQSKWSNWGSCSVTCGQGVRKRSRFCTVVPVYPPAEEDFCNNPSEQTIECYNEPCLVNGNFTPWTDWSVCTTSCGFGTRTRYRNCTNPPPLFRGSDCLGPLYEVKECENVSVCPDDNNFSPWADWGSCSSECEGIMYKTRECAFDDESSCKGLTNVSISCNTQLCPVDGGWSTWTPWSLCSKTCGHQEEVRTRVCNNPVQRNGGKYCEGHDIEVMPCNDYDFISCPEPPPGEWSDWSWWTVCKKACGGGYQERFRLCNNPPPAPGAPECAGEGSQTLECNVHPCPVHGNFSEWSVWAECTKECGNGTQVRVRACSNPQPTHGGNPCLGDVAQTKFCNVQHCPIDGNYTNWSPWFHCNKPCGTGSSDRKRSCTNPTPMYGGMNCTGPSFESDECNTHPCSPADILLDVTFNAMTMAEYNNDGAAFENRVTDIINSVNQQYPPSVNNVSCSAGLAGGVRCVLNLNYQSVSKDELVGLQDKLLHPATSTRLHNMTSLNLLSSPLALQVTVLSSTSIRADWPELPSHAVTATTKSLSGYILFYKRTSEENYRRIGVSPGGSTVLKTIETLKKFTSYRMVVCPYSGKGNGIPSQPVTAVTSEDIPSIAPMIMNISSPNSTSLKLSWNAINEQNWHGVQRGYCVRYVASGSTTGSTHYVTDVAQLETVIPNLEHYTRYDVYVSAKTTPGCGIEARTSFLTLEYSPSQPPQNVKAVSLSTTVGVRVMWDEVVPEARHGVIRGYKVSCEDADGAVKWENVSGADNRVVEITSLKFLSEYKVKVLAFTSVGDGQECDELFVTTDESTPARAPELLEARNTTSSSIFLRWTTIPSEYHQGTLLGYRVYYRPSQTTRERKFIEIPVNPHILECHLTNLFWWWWYDIQIAGFTRMGTGVTLNVSVQTDEEIPSRYPENIRGLALTTTSMLFEWDPVLPGFAHGNLVGYNLTVRETNIFDNLIVSTIISHPERSHYVDGLRKYTNYSIWVRAINSKGEGPVYSPGFIDSTGEDGPEFAPDNIVASTLEHISVIKLEWTRIPPQYHNGILRGYYVEYTATILAGEVVPTDERVLLSKRVRGNRYSTVLTDLSPGSVYEIKVFGYTSRNGTKSNITIAETCRCPKYLRANWWTLPPYTNLTNPDSPGGIFFTITRHILYEMCGTCANSYGETEFCYEKGCDRRRQRRSTSNSYQKNSLQSVSASIGDNVEISFPVQGNRYMTTYAGVFPYISVVDAPGSAYFTVKNVPSTATVVVTASLACLPMVLLMCLFAWVAGIIVWLLERKENNDHFPESFSGGVVEGFWWAFISMTTVGYGDRSPVTVAGRVFAIVWILMGLLIISIVTGGIVTSITSVLVIQEDKLYGAQVGAIINSSEYSKAVRQNADVVAFKNMEDIIKAMHKKEVNGALLDIYASATKKDLFHGGDIQLNRLIEYPTGFGFVLSGNMAKAAPLLRQALASQKPQLTFIVEESTDTISQDRNEAEEAKEKTSGLFDPEAEAFQRSFKVTVSLLAVVIFTGLLWHYGRHRKKEEREQKEKMTSLSVSEYLRSDGRQTLQRFNDSLKQHIGSLRKKQIQERKKTWFYKAVKYRVTSNASFNLRKSSARIRPVENTTFTENELRGTSPESQSSLESFYIFQNKKANQVYPMLENTSRPDSLNQTSISKEHDEAAM